MTDRQAAETRIERTLKPDAEHPDRTSAPADSHNLDLLSLQPFRSKALETDATAALPADTAISSLYPTVSERRSEAGGTKLTLHALNGHEVSVDPEQVHAVHTAAAATGFRTQILTADGRYQYVKEPPEEVSEKIPGLQKFTLATTDTPQVRHVVSKQIPGREKSPLDENTGTLYVNPQIIDAVYRDFPESGSHPASNTGLILGNVDFHTKEPLDMVVAQVNRGNWLQEVHLCNGEPAWANPSRATSVHEASPNIGSPPHAQTEILFGKKHPHPLHVQESVEQLRHRSSEKKQ